MEPQILLPSYGVHNSNLEEAARRIEKSSQWKKLDTIILIPAAGTIPTKVVSSWLNLMTPPNNAMYRMFCIGMEVGAAYSQAIEMILANPDLNKWKYILTIEHDNIPQPDALLKLLADMEEYPEYACIGGLYFTKGPDGVPQIWGDPRDVNINFRPQIPLSNTIQECVGTGMGFNLWRLEMFKDTRLRRPWFKTLTGMEGQGMMTQDLYFWSDARKYGYRCAVDTRIPVGHYDINTDITW